MPSLKFLRNRIASVKSTKKITSAMKMVAASKLRQSQERQAAARPYAAAMKLLGARILNELKLNDMTGDFPILSTDQDCRTHLLIVTASDRGLCGGFNGNLVREAKRTITELRECGKEVRLICIGRKVRDLLKRDYASIITASYEEIAKPTVPVSFAEDLAKHIIALYDSGEIGSCSIVYNRFVNALIQEPSKKQIIPYASESAAGDSSDESGLQEEQGIYRFEPNPGALFAAFLPQAVTGIIYHALTDSAAGEQAARMNAMDNATNNAGDMIDKLTIKYNRARQANITRELIEIISAMEAM